MRIQATFQVELEYRYLGVFLNVNFIDMTLHKSMCFLSFASHVKVCVRNLIFLCHFYLATPIFCCNPNLGFTTKARGWKVAGQEENLGVTSHALGNAKSVRE